MDDRAELDRALTKLVCPGGIEEREDGKWLAGLANLQCEMARRTSNQCSQPLKILQILYEPLFLKRANRFRREFLSKLASSYSVFAGSNLHVEREKACIRYRRRAERLTTAKLPLFETSIGQLDLHRSALAENRKDYLYRAVPERWLETLILEDPSRLDAILNPKFLYH